MGSLGRVTYLHLVLDPGPNGIGLGRKLAPQALISMLASQLLLQGLVADGHQLLHLSGPKDKRVSSQLRSPRNGHRTAVQGAGVGVERGRVGKMEEEERGSGVGGGGKWDSLPWGD